MQTLSLRKRLVADLGNGHDKSDASGSETTPSPCGRTTGESSQSSSNTDTASWPPKFRILWGIMIRMAVCHRILLWRTIVLSARKNETRDTHLPLPVGRTHKVTFSNGFATLPMQRSINNASNDFINFKKNHPRKTERLTKEVWHVYHYNHSLK
jgi:hypothetical protein